MSRRDHEHVAEWDAAYVLGALTPVERRLYEEHLEQCPSCRESVNELSPMPGLLAQIRPAPEARLVVQTEEPADLMDAMLRKEHRRSARRRRLLGWAGAAAAALLLVIVATVAVILRSPDDTVSVALEPVESVASSMSVEVTLAPTDWGTRLSVECEYPTHLDYQERQTWYALVVTDSEGTDIQVSTWRAVPGETVALDAATAVSLADIDSLTVVTAAGQEVLTAPIRER